ncbi:MAG: hypothetical protein V4764_00835 [Burkholderia sp.]
MLPGADREAGFPYNLGFPDAAPHFRQSMPSTPAPERVRLVRRASALSLDLPQALVDALGLGHGDEVEIRAHASGHFDVSPVTRAEDPLARLRRFRGRVPAGLAVDDGGDAP